MNCSILALLERCLNHIVPILIEQDLRQFWIIDELVNDFHTFWLLCFFQTFLNHVATALLHG
uniref:Uncharacterized protein n=1 Tax=Arundo donax TaxID=35708 RepID=A0A0A8Y448_ARUDO